MIDKNVLKDILKKVMPLSAEEDFLMAVFW
jgi:hypothetical protein